MYEIVAVGFGILGIVIVSVLLCYTKWLKNKFKRYVLRFDQIKDKLE